MYTCTRGLCIKVYVCTQIPCTRARQQTHTHNIYMYVCVCVCVRVCVYVCLCVYTYIHTYIHTYVFIHTHCTQTQTDRQRVHLCPKRYFIFVCIFYLFILITHRGCTFGKIWREIDALLRILQSTLKTIFFLFCIQKNNCYEKISRDLDAVVCMRQET
jgi:hypothetical protein